MSSQETWKFLWLSYFKIYIINFSCNTLERFIKIVTFLIRSIYHGVCTTTHAKVERITRISWCIQKTCHWASTRKTCSGKNHCFHKCFHASSRLFISSVAWLLLNALHPSRLFEIVVFCCGNRRDDRDQRPNWESKIRFCWEKREQQRHHIDLAVFLVALIWITLL